MKFLLTVFILVFLLQTTSFSQDETADFIIAENPAQFEILNQYQQKLKTSQKDGLLSNTPWQIVEENIPLSDGYSKAMKVRFNGEIFFFAINEDGNLRSTSLQQQYEIFKNCQLLNELLTITMEDVVLFRDIPFSSNKNNYQKSYLKVGTEIQKIFKKGPSYFVKNKTQNRFGWLRINNSNALEAKNINKRNIQSGFTEILKSQVNQKVSEINSVYTQLFKHLNSKYGQQKPVPYWEMTSLEEEIQLTLRNENPEKTKKSMAYFINDLENMIIGHSVAISKSQSQIILKMQANE